MSANTTERNEKQLCHHDRLLPVAEEKGRALINSWMTYGPKQKNYFDPERMPTGPLAQVAAGVLEAMLNQGIRSREGILTFFIGCEDGTRGELHQCMESFSPEPSACAKLIEGLAEYDLERSRFMIAAKLNTAILTGQDPAPAAREFVNLDTTVSKPDAIADQLAARVFDFDKHPEKPIPIFRLCNMPLSTAGNLTNIQALPKAGKSAVMESMIAASMNGNRQGPDTLGFVADNPQGHALIHFDTEQSRYDADALIRRACRRAQVDRPPVWLMSYSVADLGIKDRRQALRHVMGEARENHGGIFAVMIDGIGDLCADPNDSEEAFDLVHELHALTITHDCTIATVLHENPGSESGGGSPKTRGHLGSQLERKAETNLRLAKDKDGITTIWAERARHCYLPKDQGPCFSWNDQAGMHTSCGTSGEIKSAAMREKLEGEADSAFGGENSLSYSALVSAIRDSLDVSERTAKSRIKTWLAEGITRKDSTGNHHLANP